MSKKEQTKVSSNDFEKTREYKEFEASSGYDPNKELIDGEYYWVKSSKASEWEIAEYLEKRDVFEFTDSSYTYRKDCFKIDYKCIERPKK